MSNIAYMTIKGATQGDMTADATTADSIGNLWQQGHEGESLVYAFEQNAVVPRDPQSGSVIATRRHMPTTFMKPVDKATPLMWQALATGETLEIEVQFWRTSTAGVQEHYYTIKFTDAVLVEGKTILPDVNDEANASRGDTDKWSFTYRKAEWTHEKAGTSASDDYRAPGSIMMYVVWQALIAIALSVGLALYYLILFRVEADPVPVAGAAGGIVISFLAGLAFGCAAKLRALDAGKNRLFALLGIIPIGNLFLMIFPPKEDPSRPPYWPSARPVRVLIGLAAIGGFAALWPFNAAVGDYLVGDRLQTIAKRGDFTASAIPPQEIAPAVKADGFTVYRNERGILYRFVLTHPGVDPDRLRNWLVEKMLPSATKLVCEQPLVAQAKWTIAYDYRDAADNLIANVSILPSDCTA
eukprot:g1343.t1